MKCELAGRSILIVEDELLIALGLRRDFENAGAQVFAATQLPHALRLAWHPDLSAAVLDYRLGPEDCTPICSVLDARGIPFVFYSGYDEMHKRWPEAVRLSKPARGDALLDAVGGAISRSYSAAA